MKGHWPDLVLAGILALATFVVHDVGYLLSSPFWTDEAWVAISTRLPLRQLTTVTASTPTGWTFLLRLVVVGGDERLRIVPLVFAALTVLAAYAYVRTLPWASVFLARLASVLGAAAALLIPSALARDDLKQYTADAFLTLLILWCAARLEADWTRRRLVQLATVVVVGFLFSAVGVFVGAATFAGLLLVELVGQRRGEQSDGGGRWTRARDTALVGGVTGMLLVVIFLVLYRPGIVPGLHDYWADHYLPISQGWGPSWRFLQAGGTSMAGYLGTGSVLIALLLTVAGVVTLVRLRRVALAVVVPLLLVEMVGLGAARQYPLFDLRTSHFLTTALAVTAAVGVAGICALLARVHVGVAAAAAVIVVALFGQQVRVGVRAQDIPEEDLRTPALYLSQHLGDKDIVVLNMLSSWGFAYYWPRGAPAVEPVTSNLQRFVAVFPDQPHLLVAGDRTPAAVAEVMAAARAAAAHVGPGARIWFVHQHTIDAELSAYRSAIVSDGLATQNVLPGALDLLTAPG